MTLADSSSACSNGPVGYALPALYRAASSSYADDFNDVRTGDNDFTDTNGGKFAAADGYDEASGLGSPNATALAASLCAGSVRMTAPHSQQSALGASVSVQLHAQDGASAALHFRATGLPPGLSVDGATGQITGRPRHTGTFHVTATATDRQGATSGAKFSWSVGGATRILDPSLSGVGDHRPTLKLTVVTGTGAPPMSKLALELPKELRLVSAHGLRLAARGMVDFTAQATGDTLTIELERAFRRVKVSLAYPALVTSGARHPDARDHGALELGLTVLDSRHGSSELRARLLP
jgi:hypothetical protein